MLSCNTMFDMAATTIQRNLQTIRDILKIYVIESDSMITTNLTFCVVVVAVASAAYVCGAAKGAFTSSTADV